ncbi:D-alanyl-D-alanine carboxypeptidase/D-alanyl-D-alanine endopeptidase [Nocardioides piscis]|uniref:D-alanyl-D-alanine carboxypeptidase/D-alanyl-D-alanine-endopeptidase n=1 Tax=Nocardioides piscis TaxID=2714938 RepID=A0A6G7YD35_9ACTN|nr:D-alanyl-D-alanine carboxypeptidase/D-alanyl-D-alanine-endopeptidase [Nocardioides piscis]QIK74548.1 D-alanyl-D-alanine carboxypeptidase/D-alanyl-D-alanine-endopeptidase [Nocardioides piscis]
MGRDRRHPVGAAWATRWLPVLLVLALLGSGVAAHRYDWGPRYLGWYGDDITTDPAAVAPPAGLELPAWSPPAAATPVTDPPLVDATAIQTALEQGLRNKTLGKHVVAGVGDLSGDGPVWTHDDGQFLPASTTKLVTAAAALAALGPETRFTTSVVQGDRPREVVLVGGGDPYLASRPATPEEQATVYPDRADVVTLARQAAARLPGRKPVRVVYDDSLFTGPTDNPKWRVDYVRDDIVSPITALWVDRGASPTGYGRSDDPSLTAAATFAAALEQAGVRVRGEPVRGTAGAGAVDLASVESAPLAQIVERLLDVSDNETAEVLAHHVGLAVSGDGSFAGGSTGVLSALQSLGVETGADVVHDGSGLSRSNRLSPATLIQVLQVAARPDHPDLRTVLTGLPVAGFTGSLAGRFAESDATALGDVRAKTGTLSGVSSLAGVVAGRDGTEMVFVLAVDKTGKAREVDVEAALDDLAADLAACVCGAVA